MRSAKTLDHFVETRVVLLRESLVELRLLVDFAVPPMRDVKKRTATEREKKRPAKSEWHEEASDEGERPGTENLRPVLWRLEEDQR